MKVEIIKCLEDNYSYLIIDSKKNACVVDPSEEGPVIASVESNQANLKYILNTHHHFDHIITNLFCFVWGTSPEYLADLTTRKNSILGYPC